MMVAPPPSISPEYSTENGLALCQVSRAAAINLESARVLEGEKRTSKSPFAFISVARCCVINHVAHLMWKQKGDAFLCSLIN